MPEVLLTGATGFIGSHTCVEVMAAGWTPIIADNLSNSSVVVLDRIALITGRRPVFVKADIRDRTALDRIFSEHAIEAVIHFAGLKAVGESVAEPLRYYDNNVCGTLTLLDAMNRHRVKRMVFSSSACFTSEFTGTMGISSAMRTFPDGLIEFPAVRAVITSSGDIL